MFSGDTVCSSLRQSGYKHGESIANGDLNQEAMENWQMYQDFRDQVMDRLIDELGL
jgi:hypothetical protein